MDDGWPMGRLRARPPLPEDEGAYRALLLDPAVAKWLRPAPLQPFTPVGVAEMLAADERHWAEHGFGPWTLVDPGDGAFVGRGGLQRAQVEGESAVELPWTIVSERWGEGLASEAAAAAAEWARSLGLSYVVALIRPQNAASIRVAEKVGLERERLTLHAGLPHVVYRLR
jgi:RimJ/RimL family protein N-acetyltransferase